MFLNGTKESRGWMAWVCPLGKGAPVGDSWWGGNSWKGKITEKGAKRQEKKAGLLSIAMKRALRPTGRPQLQDSVICRSSPTQVT